MKPAPFDYAAPREVEEVLALLAQYGDDAKILAGGQSLGPMLNLRVVRPAVLVDINAVAALARLDAGGAWTLGALVRQCELEDHPRLGAAQPLLAAAIPHIAHRPIRNRGTVGGSLAHADPAAEWGALALALDARLEIARAGHAPRTLRAQDFFRGMLETDVAADELLASVRLPAWPPGTGFGFREFARRRGDFALAGVACRVSLDARGCCRDTRIALFGVGDRPLRGADAETALDAQLPGPVAFDAAARAAAAQIEPLDDLHASAAYRRRLVGILVREALDDALAGLRAQEIRDHG